MRTTSKKIIAKLDRMKEIKNQIENLEREYESLKEDIIQFMNGDDELLTDTHHVRYTEYIRERFDSKTFKVANPEIYGLYSKVQECKRFTIS